MNKGELINAIARSAGLTKVQAARVLNVFLEAVTDALKRGDTVSLVGFGAFAVTDRPKRTGRNPQTGEKLNIPAASKPVFKAGKSL
ncbi:HU family DNA-binding protein, partial [Pseudomonas sp. GD03689]